MRRQWIGEVGGRLGKRYDKADVELARGRWRSVVNVLCGVCLVLRIKELAIHGKRRKDRIIGTLELE